VIEIYNNQQLTVGQSGCKDGSQTLTVWKDRTKSIETGDETVAIKQGKRTTTVEGDDTLTIKSGNQAITVESGDHSLSVDAGKSVIEAAQSILLTVGGSSIKIEPYAITIKSVSISIEGDASVDVKSPLTTCEGSGTLTLKGGMTMIN
ncbi:MAG: hypothetical protein KDA45_07730, partial [Planctomycetales bacterium]|nr:hypothetical protein [Planctomycetales bacterium]